MNKIIALDAGHGMNTAGKRCMKSIDSDETREWWLNDRIADRLEELLAGYDCTVLRVDDTTGAKDISLSARVKVANAAGADIYISIHHNAGLNGKSGGGTVIFYSSSKTDRVKQAQNLYNSIVSKTGLRGNRIDKIINKGFYVIKNTKMPAFLIENGFMDSPSDVPIILTATHAEKTAQGILEFLVSELSLTKRSKIDTAPIQPSIPQDNTPYTTVNKGDTLSGIAKKFDLSWQEIARLNGIESPYTIKVGQKIYLPMDKQKILCYPAYTGKKTTLTAALTSLGVCNSYTFRKRIALANDIIGYIGTASQNTIMYNLLVAGLLKKV